MENFINTWAAPRRFPELQAIDGRIVVSKLRDPNPLVRELAIKQLQGAHFSLYQPHSQLRRAQRFGAYKREVEYACELIDYFYAQYQQRGKKPGPACWDLCEYLRTYSFPNKPWDAIRLDWQVETDLDCIKLINERPCPGFSGPRLYNDIPPPKLSAAAHFARNQRERKRKRDEDLHLGLPGEFSDEERDHTAAEYLASATRAPIRLLQDRQDHFKAKFAFTQAVVDHQVAIPQQVVDKRDKPVASLRQRAASAFAAAKRAAITAKQATTAAGFVIVGLDLIYLSALNAGQKQVVRRSGRASRKVAEGASRVKVQLEATVRVAEISCISAKRRCCEIARSVEATRAGLSHAISRSFNEAHVKCSRTAGELLDAIDPPAPGLQNIQRFKRAEVLRRRERKEALRQASFYEKQKAKIAERKELARQAQRAQPEPPAPQTPSKAPSSAQDNWEDDFSPWQPPVLTPTPAKTTRIASQQASPSLAARVKTRKVPGAYIETQEEEAYCPPEQNITSGRGPSKIGSLASTSTSTSTSTSAPQQGATVRADHVTQAPCTSSRAAASVDGVACVPVDLLSPPSQQLQAQRNTNTDMAQPKSMLESVFSYVSGFASSAIGALGSPSAKAVSSSPVSSPHEHPFPADHDAIMKHIAVIRRRNSEDARLSGVVSRTVDSDVEMGESSNESEEGSDTNSFSEDELAQPESTRDYRPQIEINSLTDVFRAANMSGQAEETRRRKINEDQDSSRPGSRDSSDSQAPNSAKPASSELPYSKEGTLGHMRKHFIASQPRLNRADPFAPIDWRAPPQPLRSINVQHQEVSERRKKAREAKKQREAQAEQERLEREREAKEAEQKPWKQGLLVAPTRPFIPAVPRAWRQRVNAEMAKPTSTIVAKTPKGTDIDRRSFGTCLPQHGVDDAIGWLNDEVIMGYLEHIMEYGKGNTDGNPRSKQDKPDVPRYVAFANNLWTQITSKGVKSVARWPSRSGLKDPAAWFQTEIVFVPVNNGAHWTICAIRPKQKRVEFFDSMGSRPGNVYSRMSDFLADQLGAAYVKAEWKFSMPKVPQQNNSSDCGVFAITAAQALVLGLDPLQSYSAADMQNQRMRILAVMLNGGLKGDFLPEDPLAKHMQ